MLSHPRGVSPTYLGMHAQVMTVLQVPVSSTGAVRIASSGSSRTKRPLGARSRAARHERAVSRVLAKLLVLAVGGVNNEPVHDLREHFRELTLDVRGCSLGFDLGQPCAPEVASTSGCTHLGTTARIAAVEDVDRAMSHCPRSSRCTTWP